MDIEEGLISWRIDNFITFVLMIGLIWCAIGFLGHVFVRRPALMAANENEADENPVEELVDEFEAAI